MAKAPLLVDRMLDPIALALNAKAINALCNLRADNVLQRRVDRLATKANEGDLSDKERDEYRAYIAVNDVLSMLRLRAIELRRRPRTSRKRQV